MADDPITKSKVREYTSAPGQKTVIYLVTGPADYDATNGAAADFSGDFVKIDNVTFGGVTAKADALVIPRYVNDDYDDADGGAVYFTWSGTAGAVLANVDDTTALTAYQWRCTVTGIQAVA
jgi:hypothetical protein